MISAQVEGSECIVTKAKGNERYEVKFAGARKFSEGGRWCGTYKRSELQVIDRPKISDDKEEEFDINASVEAAPKPPKRARVAEPPVAEPAEPEIHRTIENSAVFGRTGRPLHLASAARAS